MDPWPGDRDLVATALGGDPAALGLLLERHRAAMRAVAAGLLGWGPDAEDAVQDAMLVALGRIGDLRDPAAAGGWLRAVTRNECRARLRRRQLDVSCRDPDTVRSPVGDPERAVEEHALREWVWTAVESLTEPLQTVVLLRYFTEVRSYEQIAAACAVPVGTVRSRLSEARRRLTARLLAEPTGAAHDVRALTDSRRRDAEDLLAAAERDDVRRVLADRVVPDLLLVGPQGQRAHGTDLLVHIMESDVRAGVRQRVATVTAGRHITILECDLHSPPWDPDHCPPGVLWVIRLAGTRIDRIRLFHPQP